jgi:hypothetical protein
VTGKSHRHPDLLRRFVPTPYVIRSQRPSQVCVESNDLEVALAIRQCGRVMSQGRETGGLLCKIIRDGAASVEGGATMLVADVALRVLQRGSGTILIYDCERAELLGFIPRYAMVEELISSLIPMLFDA